MRTVGSKAVGVYRRLWDYAQHSPHLSIRRPITILRPKAPSIRLPYALRFAHLQDTYRRPWDYLARRYTRMPITILRPKQPRWPVPHAIRFSYLQDTFRRPFDYAPHHYARRRKPITITELPVVSGLLRLPYAYRFRHILDQEPIDHKYYAQRHLLLRRPIPTAVGICDLLIEPNQVLVNSQLVNVASDVGIGGQGAGGYITDPRCYVRKYT